jgi:hypothetical protein
VSDDAGRIDAQEKVIAAQIELVASLRRELQEAQAKLTNVRVKAQALAQRAIEDMEAGRIGSQTAGRITHVLHEVYPFTEQGED